MGLGEVWGHKTAFTFTFLLISLPLHLLLLKGVEPRLEPASSGQDEGQQFLSCSLREPPAFSVCLVRGLSARVRASASSSHRTLVEERFACSAESLLGVDWICKSQREDLFLCLANTLYCPKSSS